MANVEVQVSQVLLMAEFITLTNKVSVLFVIIFVYKH